MWEWLDLRPFPIKTVNRNHIEMVLFEGKSRAFSSNLYVRFNSVLSWQNPARILLNMHPCIRTAYLPFTRPLYIEDQFGITK